MRRNKIMTRKAFEAWLRGKGATDTVGLRRETGECPLACYLRDLGVHMPYVSTEYYQAAPLTDGKVELPAWAQHIVSAVDFSNYAPRHAWRDDAVTVREVRRILRAKRPS